MRRSPRRWPISPGAAAFSSWARGVLHLSGAAALVGTALTPARVPEELGRLFTGIGSRLRRSGTPRGDTPDGTTLPGL